MGYDWDEAENLEDNEIEENEEREEIEHDLDYWAEEAESSDAIAEDERITAELEDAYIAVVESELEKEEEPAGFDDGIPEDEHDVSAPVSFSTLRQETAEVAVDRTSKAARTEEDFKIVIGEMDRLDKNRRRRERYHEVLRGDVPLEYKTTYDGLIFPLYLSDPKQRLLFRGQFWDILCDCPYEMHELTGNTFLSKMVKDLKMDHKELLYYLSLHLHCVIKYRTIFFQIPVAHTAIFADFSVAFFSQCNIRNIVISGFCVCSSHGLKHRFHNRLLSWMLFAACEIISFPTKPQFKSPQMSRSHVYFAKG